jgi:hypothetical protein
MDPSFRVRFDEYLRQAEVVDWERNRDPLSSDNDLGIDVVAWRPFADSRGGNLHLLVQCATGADWQEKLADIDLEVLKDHLHLGVPPIRVFATPLVISLPEARWTRVVRRGGLFLDRPRLLELSQSVELPQALVRVLRSRGRDLLAV